MPLKHRACLPFIRPSEPSFVPKLNYRFDVPVDHMVRLRSQKRVDTIRGPHAQHSH